MADWIRSVKSELYKIAHSALLPIHTLVPLVAMGVILLYYGVSVWSATEKIYGYIQIVSAAFPFLIGIVCAVSAAQEQQAGSFRETLGFAGPRSRAHLSRLASLLVSGCFATLIAIVGFALAFRSMGDFSLGWIVSLKIALLLFFCKPSFIRVALFRCRCRGERSFRCGWIDGQPVFGADAHRFGRCDLDGLALGESRSNRELASRRGICAHIDLEDPRRIPKHRLFDGIHRGLRCVPDFMGKQMGRETQ